MFIIIIIIIISIVLKIKQLLIIGIMAACVWFVVEVVVYWFIKENNVPAFSSEEKQWP